MKSVIAMNLKILIKSFKILNLNKEHLVVLLSIKHPFILVSMEMLTFILLRLLKKINKIGLGSSC